MWHVDLKQLKFIEPMLREILEAVEKEFGAGVITSLYRIDDPGVHGTLPLRAIDIHCENHDMGGIIEDWVNDHFLYDPTRPDKPCCIYHDTGSGFHLHLQVHPRTEKIKP